MKHTIKLKPFIIPNFAIIDGPKVTRSAGLPNFAGQLIPIEHLERSSLDELIQDFQRRLIEKWEKGQKNI